jgi:large conductance mechanosensitive channel
MLIQELKGFLMRGSIVELAVGVIIGSAFGKIVSAMVDKILMPILGIAMGGVNFQNLTMRFLGVNIEYGAFIQASFDFILIGVVLFFLLRLLGKHPGMAVPAGPPPTEVLLAEIRDLLKEQKGV